MEEYSDFSVEQFVMDDRFQDWVRRPSPESILFWKKFLAKYPHKAEVIRQARLILLSVDFNKTPEKEIPSDLIFNRIQASIRRDSDGGVTSRTSFGGLFYKIAATFLGLLISAAALYVVRDSDSQVYSTGYGEISNITLPDGSVIVLNSNSSIHFNDDWHDRQTREVWLEGEAFFNVTHTKDHDKFIVYTNELEVEVLGTEFNVRERRDVTQVVLLSGKVKLNKTRLVKDVVFMEPGESVVLRGEDKLTKNVVDPNEFSAWTKKQLIFKATALSEIAAILEDNYGWKIYFQDDSIKNYRFTGTVSTESAADIDLLLYSVSEAFELEVLKKGNEITFKRKR